MQSVPITIETEQLSFFMFKTGVLTASSWTKLDHRVLSRKWRGLLAGETKLSSGIWREQGCTRLQCAKRGADECGLSSAHPSCYHDRK